MEKKDNSNDSLFDSISNRAKKTIDYNNAQQYRVLGKKDFFWYNVLAATFTIIAIVLALVGVAIKQYKLLGAGIVVLLFAGGILNSKLKAQKRVKRQATKYHAISMKEANLKSNQDSASQSALEKLTKDMNQK